jgi:large subunit ribosomal protein L32
MPNPKRKRSHSRQGKRRANMQLPRMEYVFCPNCKEPKLPHRVCPSCGQYNGREIFKPVEE